jgi:hypothetical protein
MKKVNDLMIKRGEVLSQYDTIKNDETKLVERKAFLDQVEAIDAQIDEIERGEKLTSKYAKTEVGTDKSLGLRWVEAFKEYATRGVIADEFKSENNGMKFPINELRYDPLLASSNTGIINKTVGAPSVKTPAGLDWIRVMGSVIDENLNGNYILPSIATVTAGFVTEGGDTSTFTVAPANITLAPRPLGGNQSISKLVLSQTNPEILAGIFKVMNFAVEEAVVKDAFTQAATDLTTARLQSAVVVAPDYAKVLALDSSISVSMLNPVYVMSKAAKNYLKQVNAGGANIKFVIGDDNTINDIPVFAHPSLTANRIFLLDANDLHVGFWGQPELIIDNLTQKKSLRIEFQIQAQCDTGYANPASGVYYDCSTMW